MSGGAAVPGTIDRRLCPARRPQGLPVTEDWPLVQEAIEPAGAGGVEGAGGGCG